MRIQIATRFAVTVAALSAVALAGCSGSSKTASSKLPKKASDGVINMTLDGPVSTYDPALVSTFQDQLVEEALYDNLIDLDQNGKLIPGLATSWSSTASTATFKLRTGVTCSDGTALTPKDVAASLTRLFDPKTKASLVSQAIGAGNTATVASTADSVTIKLAKPWSDLLAGMAGPYAGIVCPAGLRDPKSMQTKSAGTGPFVSVSQITGSSYTFTRRSDYTWGPKYPDQASGSLPKTLVLKVVTDENTRANLQSTGELQVSSYSTNAWDRFKSTAGIKVKVSPQSDTMLVFNEAAGHPTADQKVRLAISQAISRVGLNKVQSYGVGKLIDSIGQPTDDCYDPGASALIPKYDTAAAATVLKGVKIRIIGTNVLAGGDANNYLLSSLQAVGANVTGNTTDNNTWVGDLFGGKNDWDITILVYGNRLGSFLQIGQFFVHAAPPAGLNIGNTKNPAAQSAYDAGAVASGTAKCTELQQMQEALLKNDDVLPLATAPLHVLFGGGVDGNVVSGLAVPGSLRIN